MSHCHVCRKDIAFFFWVNDDLWKKVAKPVTGDEIWCIDCFSIFAAVDGIDLSDEKVEYKLPPGPVLRAWISGGKGIRQTEDGPVIGGA